MLIFAPNLVPVGSVGGGIACPHRVPRARLPTVQGGLHVGPWSVQWPHRPRQSEAQGAGRQPPSCLPSLLRGFAFPPKTCLPLTWTWFKDFLLCSHSIGHRRGASSPACRARCRHPVRQSGRLRPGSAGGRDTRLRAAGAGAQARRGLGPPWAPLGPWVLRSGFAPQQSRLGRSQLDRPPQSCAAGQAGRGRRGFLGGRGRGRCWPCHPAGGERFPGNRPLT